MGDTKQVKPKFRTWLNNTEPYLASNPGKEFREETKVLEPYEEDKDGNVINKSKYSKRVPTGKKIDTQAEIDSYRYSTELKYILKELAKGNTLYARCDENEEPIDLTELPKSRAEWQQMEQLQKQIAEAQTALNAQKATIEEQKKRAAAQSQPTLTAEQIQQLLGLLKKGE